MKIALHARTFSEGSVADIERLIQALLKEKVSLAVSSVFASSCPAEWIADYELGVFSSEGPKDAQAIFSLGGDGTFLDTLTYVYKLGVPILGINMGRLGFLTHVLPKEISTSLKLFFEKKYSIENRTLVQLETVPEVSWDIPIGLNEFTLLRRGDPSLIRITCHLDNLLLNTYWADGIIISTPTGSTAYSMSCGGPLIMPDSKSLVITPINTHNFNIRPFVVSDRSTIELRVGTSDSRIVASLDSRNKYIHASTLFRIRKSPYTAQLITLKDHHFIRALKSRLNWGTDLRNGSS
ncbi:MAG: NAD kinase [Cytophagales bacterium]|nr:NAD kinase [Cytophagales bacterium]